MGPSDFGLGTELLDGIDEEDLGTSMDFDGFWCCLVALHCHLEQDS